MKFKEVNLSQLFMKPQLEYKAIFVPPELHYEIKVEALKSKLTMIEYLKKLCLQQHQQQKKK